MTLIQERLQTIRTRITDAERRYGRQAGSVRLLAVSKHQSIEAIEELLSQGQTDFGENQLQEALTKIQHFQGRGVVWHFIGPIQSNKTRGIAQHFAWVHSLDRVSMARRLSDQRPPELGPLQVCLQINISGEASKSGVSPAEALLVAHQIAALPRLALRGLMCVPAPSDDPREQRAPIEALRRLMDRLNVEGLKLDVLSAGMSNDMDGAIAEGSHVVRVGSAIFGPRPS